MFAVSVTDQDWFEFLRDREYSGQVNFWTPTPWSVRRLNAGDEWHFLLKSPIRKLSGYGSSRSIRSFLFGKPGDSTGPEMGFRQNQNWYLSPGSTQKKIHSIR